LFDILKVGFKGIFEGENPRVLEEDLLSFLEDEVKKEYFKI
jgi:flagellar motor component MotA